MSDEGIIREIVLKEVGEEYLDALVLIGSRGGENSALEESDYDVVAITSLIKTPFLLSRFDQAEEKAIEEIQKEITINPLPKFFLKPNSFYTFKIVNCSRPLYGSKFIKSLPRMNPSDISLDWRIAYQSSAILALLKSIDLEGYEKYSEISKAVIIAADNLAVGQGRYFTDKRDLISISNGEFKGLLKESIEFRCEGVALGNNSWQMGAMHSLNFYSQLLKQKYNSGSFEEAMKKDLRYSIKAVPVNLQYLLLSFRANNDLNWPGLVPVDKKYIHNAAKLLKHYTSTNSITDCVEVRRRLVDEWSVACPLGGFRSV